MKVDENNPAPSRVSLEQDRPAQAKENQEAQFDQNVAIHTLIGNLQHWRTNQRNNSKRMNILVGRAKIFSLLDRFKCRVS